MNELELNDLINPVTTSETSSDNELQKEVITNLFNKDNIKTNSRIAKYQVNPITKLLLFADFFQSDFARNLATNILELQVSLNGYGRKELVQILAVSSPQLEEEKPIKKGIFR